MRPSTFRTVSAEITVERNGAEVALIVSGPYEPGDPGVTTGPMEHCYPPEGGGASVAEILSLATEAPWPGELTDEERSAAEAALCEVGDDWQPDSER